MLSTEHTGGSSITDGLRVGLMLVIVFILICAFAYLRYTKGKTCRKGRMRESEEGNVKVEVNGCVSIGSGERLTAAENRQDETSRGT